MTEQELCALKFYVASMKSALARRKELTQRPHRNTDLRLLGNPALIQEEMLRRNEELEIRSNLDVVFAIRMELLLHEHRNVLEKHGIVVPELPLSFEEMKLPEEEDSGEDKPLSTELN